MSGDRTERAKVFIYGQIGEILNDLDKKRLMGIIQNNPNTHLFQISLSEILEILNQIEKLEIPELAPKDRKGVYIAGIGELLASIKDHNYKSNLFRELAEFSREDLDDLSRGSLLLGETEQTGLMEVFEDG